MKISYLFLFVLHFNNALLGYFKPLEFEKADSENTLSHLLKNTTLLYYEIQELNFKDEQSLSKVIVRQLDLIGAIHVFKYQSKPDLWRDDLLYLIDLIFRITLNFEALKQDLFSDQVRFIQQLFLQIEQLLTQLL